MPGPNLGTAYVQVMPTTEGISGSLTKLFSGEAQTAGEKCGDVFSGGFSSKLKAGLKIAAGAMLAFGAVGTAVLAKGIKDTAAYGDHVDKMSQKIGFTAEEYQKWDYVLQRAGADVDSMQSSMKTLSKAAVENSDAFQKLGISQEDLANMSQGELFEETVKRLSAMENQTERTALATQLLGRGATELGPLFNEGTGAIEEQMEMAEKYGMIMSDDAVKASADFTDSMTTLSMTLTGFKNRVFADFLPSVTTMTNGLAKLAMGDMTGFDDLVAGFGELMAKLKEKIPQLIAMGGTFITAIITGITNAIPKLAEKGAELISNLGKGTDGKMGEFVAKAFDLIKNFAAALAQAAITLVPAAIKRLVEVITQTNWLQLGKDIVTKLWNGLKAVVPAVLGYVKQFVASVLNALGFSGLVAKVKGVFQSVRDAIKAPIEKAKELVTGAVSKIKGLFPLSMGKIFSGIKLPHFKISGGKIPWGIGGAGVKPSVDIDWYAQGAIMTKPTLFGGGEAGAEGIIPLDPFWKRMDKIAEAATGGPITINVYGSDGMSAYDIAAEVKRQLIKEQNQRRLAWQ